MPADRTGWTTVREQIVEMRLHYTKTLHWQAGALCRQRWFDRYESLPEKDLRQKTLTKGSHMFAIYPPSFIPVIRAVLQSLQDQEDQQGWLF